MDYKDKIDDITNNVVAEPTSASYTYNARKQTAKMSAEQYAKQICFTQEEYEELKSHNFYLDETPESNLPSSVEEEIDILDAADKEGYVSQEEVAHLRSLWKHVS